MHFVRPPDRFMPHTVRIRRLLGQAGAGPVYGDPVTVRAWADDERTLVRSRTGAEVVSESQVTVDWDVEVPEGSLVTVWPGEPREREAEVIVTGRHHHPTLPSYQTLSLT